MTMALLGLFTAYTPGQTSDKEFNAFWKIFKTAVAANDKPAIANLTKLPFLYDGKERDRSAFLKIYPRLFAPSVRRCIARAKLTKEQENYDVFCGQLILLFGKDASGQFKFLEFGVND